MRQWGEVESQHSARVGFHIEKFIQIKPIPYNIKSKVEAAIVSSQKYRSRPHPNIKNDFEILINSAYTEERDNLQMQQLRSSNMLLTEQLLDFSKMKLQRNIAVAVSIISIVVNVIIAVTRK